MPCIAAVPLQVAVLGILLHLLGCWGLLQPTAALHQQSQVALLLSSTASGHLPVSSVHFLCAGWVRYPSGCLCLGTRLLDCSLVCCCGLCPLGLGAHYGM